jgi:hypothetical protein
MPFLLGRSYISVAREKKRDDASTFFRLKSYPRTFILGSNGYPRRKGPLGALAGNAGSADPAYPDLRPQYEQDIASAIEQTSENELLVEHGAL